MKQCFFVTATGTDIGKTYMSCLALRGARGLGLDVKGIKPVISGFCEEDFGGSDPALLLGACGVEASLDNVKEIAPFRLSLPLSPDMASRVGGEGALCFEDIVGFCRGSVAEQEGGLLLMESVGGVMVPLCEGYHTGHLLAALNIPILLVAGNYLGTISHTLSAAHYLLAENMPLGAILLNPHEDVDISPLETMKSLRNHLPKIPLFLNSPERSEKEQAQALIKFLHER